MNIWKKRGKIVNWLIVVILFPCLYCVGCCGFHIFPTLGTSIWYDEINNVLLGLSLSYISGLIIFLLTSVLPKKNRENEIQELWSDHLNDMFSNMDDIIGFLCVLSGSNKQLFELKEDDLRCLDECNLKGDNIPLVRSVCVDGKKQYDTIDYYQYPKVLKSHYHTIINVISRMIDSPLAQNSKSKLVDLLIRIKYSAFLNVIKTMPIEPINSAIGVINEIHVDGLSRGLVEYIGLYKELGAYTTAKRTFMVRKETKEEEANRISASKALLNKIVTE